MNRSFGEQLKILMSERNITASKLAKIIGVSPKTVLEWVDKGGRMPRSVIHIRKLSDYFKISVHQLLFGEDDPRGMAENLFEKTEIHSGLYEITIKKIK
jgi:transcriptional regulator with XRE-family HTH domain